MDQEQQVPTTAGVDDVVGAHVPEGQAAAAPLITMYTTSWCGDCVAAKRYLGAKGIAYAEVDIEQDERAAELVMELNGGKRSVPTLVSGSTAASLSGFSVQKARDFLTAAGLARP